MSHLREEKKMEEEHKALIKHYNSIIEHYKSELKRPVWKYTFDKEDSHIIAKRVIKNSEEEIKDIMRHYD